MAASSARVKTDAIRSLPPPILSFSAYSASLHSTGSPASAKAALKAGR